MKGKEKPWTFHSLCLFVLQMFSVILEYPEVICSRFLWKYIYLASWLVHTSIYSFSYLLSKQRLYRILVHIYFILTILAPYYSTLTFRIRICLRFASLACPLHLLEDGLSPPFWIHLVDPVYNLCIFKKCSSCCSTSEIGVLEAHEITLQIISWWNFIPVWLRWRWPSTMFFNK